MTINAAIHAACDTCGGPTHVEAAIPLGWVDRCNDLDCAGWRYRPTSDPNTMDARHRLALHMREHGAA